MMAASSLTPPLSVSYTPACPNLLHKQPHLISSCLSIPELCGVFNDFISEDCPWRNCLWDNSHSYPHYSSLCVSRALCVCSVRSCLPALPHLWCCCTKKTPFSPCFTGTINVPWPSQTPLLSFSLAAILSLFLLSCALSLSEVSCLYWMVQKQNHKPISVTLAMRLDRPNLSPSGAIGSTPVSLKRPLSSRQRGSFLFGDSCSWALAVHVTHSNLGPAVHSGKWWHFVHITIKLCRHAWRCL